MPRTTKTTNDDRQILIRKAVSKVIPKQNKLYVYEFFFI